MRKGHIPVRMCVVCRALRPCDELFRCVRQTGRSRIEPDPDKLLCGKGFYFCRDAECLEKLHKQRRLRRLFRDKFVEGTLEWMWAQLDGLDQESGLRAQGCCERAH